MNKIIYTSDSMKLNDIFTTSDLTLASTVALYFPIDSIDKTDSKRAVFIFKRQPELDDLIQAFWRGELRVEPQSFFSQIKAIKSRLYES